MVHGHVCGCICALSRPPPAFPSCTVHLIPVLAGDVPRAAGLARSAQSCGPRTQLLRPTGVLPRVRAASHHTGTAQGPHWMFPSPGKPRGPAVLCRELHTSRCRAVLPGHQPHPTHPCSVGSLACSAAPLHPAPAFPCSSWCRWPTTIIVSVSVLSAS